MSSVNRKDQAWLRLYGINDPQLVQQAVTVNDGPKVPKPEHYYPASWEPGRTYEDSPFNEAVGGSEAAQPTSAFLVLEPVVVVGRKGFRLTWTEELAHQLAKLSREELQALCQALGARACLDAYKVVQAMAVAEKNFQLARERALRAR